MILCLENITGNFFLQARYENRSFWFCPYLALPKEFQAVFFLNKVAFLLLYTLLFLIIVYKQFNFLLTYVVRVQISNLFFFTKKKRKTLPTKLACTHLIYIPVDARFWFSSFYDQGLCSINFTTTRISPRKASSPEVPAHTDRSEYAGCFPGANPPTLKSDMKVRGTLATNLMAVRLFSLFS